MPDLTLGPVGAENVDMTDSPTTTTVAFPRFGEFTYAESEVMNFPWGMPGFPTLRRWLVLQLDEQPNFVWLQSLENLEVAMPAADPFAIFERYDPALPAYTYLSLAIRDASDFTLLCVVIVGENAETMTMNLAAPIVLNLRTRNARQVMIDNDADYSMRAPIPRKAQEPSTSGSPAV